MRVHGDWLLTRWRLALHEPTATAVIADLHLGYSQARRDRGDAVPLPDPRAGLLPLRQAHEHLAFRRLVVAGDLFEGKFLAEDYNAFAGVLETLGVEWLGLVPGNHDRGVKGQADHMPIWPGGYPLGAWRVLHGDREIGPGPCVCGHWHPCVRYLRRKVPCYLVAEGHMVLPAFSRDVAGVVAGPDPRWEGFGRLAIVGGRVVEVAQ
jgi:metallophosphoesterase superfamily enzyme